MLFMQWITSLINCNWVDITVRGFLKDTLKSVSRDQILAKVDVSTATVGSGGGGGGMTGA